MPYQGQPGYPPPPRSGSPLKLVLLGLVAAIAVGFFAFSLANFLSGDEVAGPGPGESTAPTPGETTPPPEPPPVIPEPDMNPPDSPVPTTFGEAEQWLVNNALYTETVRTPTNCPVARFNAGTATAEQAQSYLNDLTHCLTMVWLEPMQRAGFQLPRPPAIVISQPGTSACGDLGMDTIAYCSGDQRIYYSSTGPAIFKNSTPDIVYEPFFLANVIGHEFGHHLQARTGILYSQTALRGETKSEELNLEMSRRKEIQADCFAGVFLHAVDQASQITDAERAALSDVTYAVGDDIINNAPGYVGDHGTGNARRAWFKLGNASPQVTTCNTWTAPADQVR